MLLLMHQWIGWKAEGYELKNESLAFDEDKCLFLLNARGNMGTHRETPCYKLYLEDHPTDEPTNSFGFCVSPFIKYLTVEMGQACGMEGFWISDQKECVRSFAPVSDGVIVKNFMRAAGFAQFVGFSKASQGVRRSGLVFLSDSCALDVKRGKILKCGTDEEYVYVYPLSPHKMNPGCSFD